MDKISIKTIWKLYESESDEIIDKQVTIFGRIHNYRFGGNKTLAFLEIMDGSTIRILQCVCNDKLPEYKQLWDHIQRGATCSLTGTLIKSPAKGQPIELQVTNYKCHGQIAELYPISKTATRDFLRTIPHLRHHTMEFTAIQMIKQTVYNGFHEAMKLLNIGEVQPTLITSNECESGSFPFKVTTLYNDNKEDFFDKPVYLTVSGQLHLEATVCGTLRDSYCMTTAFRAESSKSPLHLAEFCMPEWECIECGLDGNISIAEFTLKHIFKKVLEEYKYELEYLDQYRIKEIDRKLKGLLDEHKSLKKTMKKKDWVKKKKDIELLCDEERKRPSLIERLEKYVVKPFIVTCHQECVRLMNESDFAFEEIPDYDKDFTKEHEKYITQVLFDNMPVFVCYYPKKVKAFYMPTIDETHVDCYDLLFPYIGEVVGGSQRIDDYDKLSERMTECGISKEELGWYLDLRKYGSVPHGGAGLGLGRLLIAIIGIYNIKDMQEFPRASGLSCFA